MSLEMELAITAFSGAAALTSLCVLLAMLGTINPYHRPEVPSLGALAVIFVATYVVATTHDVEFGLDALRLTLVAGATAISRILRLAFLFQSVFLI